MATQTLSEFIMEQNLGSASFDQIEFATTMNALEVSKDILAASLKHTIMLEYSTNPELYSEAAGDWWDKIKEGTDKLGATVFGFLQNLWDAIVSFCKRVFVTVSGETKARLALTRLKAMSEDKRKSFVVKSISTDFVKRTVDSSVRLCETWIDMLSDLSTNYDAASFFDCDDAAFSRILEKFTGWNNNRVLSSNKIKQFESLKKLNITDAETDVINWEEAKDLLENLCGDTKKRIKAVIKTTDQKSRDVKKFLKDLREKKGDDEDADGRRDRKDHNSRLKTLSKVVMAHTSDVTQDLRFAYGILERVVADMVMAAVKDNGKAYKAAKKATGQASDAAEPENTDDIPSVDAEVVDAGEGSGT